MDGHVATPAGRTVSQNARPRSTRPRSMATHPSGRPPLGRPPPGTGWLRARLVVEWTRLPVKHVNVSLFSSRFHFYFYFYFYFYLDFNLYIGRNFYLD